ncbi:hypothetical protein E3N88_34574 [Mikania micrantha]|uniref:Reverse transcriptase domain-containing protein n=1 Tax=Mikania micrantha TaxID=192012 RepID=A0A5N6LYJ1_9ASTR|nr:hypothetical protein E3N88_34574 [Mikania micrantha]
MLEEEGYPWLEESITFPLLKPWEMQETPLNISANIAGHRVERIHVDGGTPSKYNAILGRPRIKALHALVSTTPGAIKFPMPVEIAIVSSSIESISSIDKPMKSEIGPEEEWILDDQYSDITIRLGAVECQMRNVVAYVDDLVIKSKEEDAMIEDIKEIFNILR